MTAQEVTAWNIANMMIKIGLRPPIVHASTGLCKNRLRSLYRQVHGKSAVQGRVSEYAYNRLKTISQVREGTIFYQIYHRLGGDHIFQVLDNKLFIEAYLQYEDLSPEHVDANTAWFIARDLRENMLKPQRCQACGRMYLHDPRSDHMIRCPFLCTA